MYILGIGHDVVEALRTLAFSLFEALLNAINTIYELFMLVAKQNLFDADTVSKIYTRIGLVLGLFMIFRLTFYAIEYLINPDTMSDKQKGIGNVVKKVLIVVVLLGSVHFLFREAYQLQDLLLNDENNLMAKIVLGNSSSSNATEGSINSGKELSWTIFSSFYTINENGCSSAGDICTSAREALDPESTDGIYYDLTTRDLGFKEAYSYLNSDNSGEYNWLISFDWFFGILTAIFILWVLLIYLIQVGIRCIQLAYLEIIAPIPIMMYLTPKGDDTLKKWGTQCLTTYLDVFLRLAVIYFIILAINAIKEANLIDSGISVGIILIIALFLFAKKVPDLVKEVFPSMGGKASLDFGMKVKEGLTLGTGMALGAVGGVATGIKYGKGTAGGRLGGALTGLARGAIGGAKTKGNILANAGKGMSSQRAAMQRAYNRNNDGSDFWGRTLGAGDAARTKAAFDQELSFYEGYQTNADIIDKELEKNEYVQHAIGYRDKLIKEGATADEIAGANNAIKETKKTILEREMSKAPADANATIMTALANAEAYRTKGKRSGYGGFEEKSITDTNLTAEERAKAFFANKDATKNETREIKEVSGSRNEAYKKAEANAKYARDK